MGLWPGEFFSGCGGVEIGKNFDAQISEKRRPGGLPGGSRAVLGRSSEGPWRVAGVSQGPSKALVENRTPQRTNYSHTLVTFGGFWGSRPGPKMSPKSAR